MVVVEDSKQCAGYDRSRAGQCYARSYADPGNAKSCDLRDLASRAGKTADELSRSVVDAIVVICMICNVFKHGPRQRRGPFSIKNLV